MNGRGCPLWRELPQNEKHRSSWDQLSEGVEGDVEEGVLEHVESEGIFPHRCQRLEYRPHAEAQRADNCYGTHLHDRPRADGPAALNCARVLGCYFL